MRLIVCTPSDWCYPTRSVFNHSTVPKDAKFYTDSKSEGKIKKKSSTKRLFTQNCSFASFFQINLYLCPFSLFRLQIWNENKILRILVPILTYFNTKFFFKIQAKFFFPQIGQYGYQKTQNFMLIPNLKMKLRKSTPIKSYLKKTCKKTVF